ERPRSERAAAARRRQREARGCLLGHASVRRIDHERRVAERAHAPFVLQKRALRGGLAAALIRACALRELLRRETRARAETLRAIQRHAAQVVGAPDALEARVAP